MMDCPHILLIIRDVGSWSAYGAWWVWCSLSDHLVSALLLVALVHRVAKDATVGANCCGALSAAVKWLRVGAVTAATVVVHLHLQLSNLVLHGLVHSLLCYCLGGQL